MVVKSRRTLERPRRASGVTRAAVGTSRGVVEEVHQHRVLEVGRAVVVDGFEFAEEPRDHPEVGEGRLDAPALARHLLRAKGEPCEKFEQHPLRQELLVGVLEGAGEEVAVVVGLRPSGGHLLGEAVAVLRDEVAREGDDAARGAEVLLEADGADVGVALGEGEDVADGGAVPLVDALVVVADDAEPGPEAREGADHALLHGVHALVLIDNDMAEAPGDAPAERLVAVEEGDGPLHDSGEVVDAALVEERPPRSEALDDGRTRELVGDELGLAQDAEGAEVDVRVAPRCQVLAVEEARGRAPAPLGVPFDQEALGDLVEQGGAAHRWVLVAEEVEAEAMDGADEHLREALHVAEGVVDARGDALLELARGLVGEGKSDDTAGRNGGLARDGREEGGDASSDDFGLAGASAGDELEVPVAVGDGRTLRGGEVHGRGASFAELRGPDKAKAYRPSPLHASRSYAASATAMRLTSPPLSACSGVAPGVRHDGVWEAGVGRRDRSERGGRCVETATP